MVISQVEPVQKIFILNRFKPYSKPVQRYSQTGPNRELLILKRFKLYNKPVQKSF